MPLTSRRTRSDEDIRNRLIKRFRRLGRDDPEGDADQMIDTIGYSESWYVERGLRAAYNARRDGRRETGLKIWDKISDRDIPPWMFWYPEENW